MLIRALMHNRLNTIYIYVYNDVIYIYIYIRDFTNWFHRELHLFRLSTYIDLFAGSFALR